MSLEDLMMSLPSCMGGKRPRSPVEKLADLQGQAEAEDEDNWRNSKRYLSEVIANGFSRLNFGLQHPHGSEQQQQQLNPQVLSLTSPRGPGGCYIQLPGGVLSPRNSGDWDMEMDSPPGCPGSSSSPRHAAAASGRRDSRSPSGKGNRPIQVPEALAGQSGSPMCSPAGGASGISPVQYPFGSYVSPGAKPLPPPAWQIAAGTAVPLGGTAVAAAATAGAASPALPKALKVAEKAPNSPSDLPTAGSNLRKVALLRSLLARTEQHLQQQQQQQQQHHHHGQLPHEQQHAQQHHQQQAHAAAHHQLPGCHQQHQQQQQQYVRDGPVTFLQGGTAAAAAGVMHNAAAELGCAPRPGEHEPLGRSRVAAAGAAEAGAAGGISGAVAPAYQHTACSTHSEDMECSSSSMCDSDSDACQQRVRAAASASDADLATSSLLCTEVLPLNGAETLMQRQQQQQQQRGDWLRHNSASSKQQQQQQHQGCSVSCASTQYGPQPSSQLQHHAPWVAQQHHMQQHQLPQLPQQPGLERQQRPLELTAEQLQQLRAKALASTSRLTELEPEDLASLQQSITASQARRGSADHTPSHLQSAHAAADPRRHSSHI